MNLRKYLEDLFALESSCYEQRQLISQLTERLRLYQSAPDRKHICGNYKDETGLGLYIFFFPILIALVFELLGADIAGYIIAAIVLVLLWVLTTPRKEREYNKRERDRVDQINRQIDEQNLQFRNLLPSRCLALEEQIHKCTQTLTESQDALASLYSLDVIFPKYRNFTAIASFYEYFCSERCLDLTGHEGAYNIYEQEVRLGIIIDKLDTIIEKLDEIGQSQYTIIEAIAFCGGERPLVR